ncbi:hypothetical protein Bbelb_014980 [Branchiostoma belcheri]|nr:hypothetical protein Bbelb_014980 [Branchiostoma belcheri]
MALFTTKNLAILALIASVSLVGQSSALSEGSNIKDEVVSYWIDNGCNFPPRTFYNSDKLDVCDRPYRTGDRTSGLCRFFYEVSKDLCYAASGETEDAQMLEMLDSYILVLDNRRLCHIFLSMDRGGILPDVNDMTRSWYKKARSILTTERSCAAVCDSAGMHPLCVAIFVSFEYIRDVQPPMYAVNLTFAQSNNTGTTTPSDDIIETSTTKQDVIEDIFELVDYEDVKDEYGTTTTGRGFSTTSEVNRSTSLQSATTPTIIVNESSSLPGKRNGSFPVYTGNKNKGDNIHHRQGAGLPDSDQLKKEEQMNYYAVLLGCSGLLIATLLYVIYKNKRAIAMLIATGRREYRSAPRPKRTDGYQRLGQQDIA